MSHSEALERQLEAAGAVFQRRLSATVTLARALAAQLDAAGPEPSTRLSAAYLSVLKDINRAMVKHPGDWSTAKASKLAELRASSRGRA